jgi:hypothetical protein
VWLSFYEPRAYIAHNSPSHTLRMFEAAVRISPVEGEGCALLRRVLGLAAPKQQMPFRGQCVPEG